jgi:phage FluMu gp28-like protein
MESNGLLLEYQKEAYENIMTHKYSVLLWARQVGKSFVISLWALMRAIDMRGHTVIIISPTERQSKMLISKVKTHVNALKIIGVKFSERFFSDTKTNALEVTLPNGSQIVGLPANPDGVRGYTGDVILEEAAFFKDGRQVLQAIFPTITRNKQYKLIAISTPKGKSDIFYHLWNTAAEDDLFFRMKLTIYDAIKKGLDIDIDELRRGCPDEDTWTREFLCEFAEENETLLPYELIQSCEQECEIDDIRELSGDIFLGIDIGRRKDLTAIAVLEKIYDITYLRKMLVLSDMPFEKQFEIIDHLCFFARRAAIDETGLGMMIAEQLMKKWGEMKILPVYFTQKTKEELASRLKATFEDSKIRIFPERDLREDLHSVKKEITPSGNIKLKSEYNKNSHADRFWATALGVKAASDIHDNTYIPAIFGSSKIRRSSRWEFSKIL